MGAAILTVTDGGGSYDLNITWDRGYDIDARIDMPSQWRQRWAMGTEMARRGAKRAEHGWLRPYSTQPFRVHASQLERSASGFYVTARIIFDKVRWRVSPPYPKSPPLPRGAIP